MKHAIAPYQTKPIPARIAGHFGTGSTQIRNLRRHFMDESHWDGKVLRWDSNNAVIPPHVFKDAYLDPLYPVDQAAAYRKELDEALDLYAARERALTPEEQSNRQRELRDAYGPGVVVVNVLTGTRTRT